MRRDDLENGMLRYKEDDGEVVKYCEWCGEPIYEGDSYFEITDDQWVCTECMSNARRTA